MPKLAFKEFTSEASLQESLPPSIAATILSALARSKACEDILETVSDVERIMRGIMDVAEKLRRKCYAQLKCIIMCF